MIGQILEFSIVVLANEHNPTILNRDFLEVNNIVQKDWGWDIARTPIATPPFSEVSYDRNVTITVDPKKLQVIDRDVEDGIGATKVKEIVQNYVETLSHVRYEALGINFRSFIPKEQPKAYLKEHFLKTAAWNDNRLEEVSYNFIYRLDSARLKLSLNYATLQKTQDDKIEGILAYGNFHRDCTGYPSWKEILEYLNNIDNDWRTFNEVLSDIWG